ncbi:helix-turn-helix domain-containing protein [Streptomyces pristinaespiralis]|uniref:helix-turn-helix domain-containing protein n=1 Tax=Streptomyces pristinaespiralis TaxID=38300 RepID=UPI0033F3D32F
MAQTEPDTPTQTIAKRVREIRKVRGLSAERLAERLAEHGIKWDRYTVTKLENGKRQNVTVSEWLALGTVLNVAPVHLLVPIDDDDADYQVTAKKTAKASDVRSWVRGQTSLGNGPHREFTAQAPDGEWVSFDTTTPEGQRAAVEWAKRSGLGTVTEGNPRGEHR